jgi:hypothetical protein
MAYCVNGCWTVSNRIGIGTESPSHPLHIYDGGNSVYTRWQRSTGDLYVGSDSIGGGVGSSGNIPLYFWTFDGTERMRISQAGCVGIGITDPIAKLHVEQSTSGEVGRFRANVDGCADLVLVNNAQTWGFRVDNAASNALHIRNFQNTTNIMTLATGGNVGIGTSSPTISGGGLEIAGGSQRGLRISSTSGNKIEIGADSSWGYIQTITAGQSLAFYGGAAQGPYMLINCAGNVGIGTTTPAYKLQVVNSGAVGVSIVTAGSDSGNPSLQLLSGATDSTISSTSNGLELTAYSAHALLLRTANVERMRITSGGNVGIGTTSPIDKFEVAGGIHTSGTAAASKACTGYLDYYVGQVRIGITGPNTTTPAIFRIDQYSSNASIICTPFYITATSNIGVNTTSPSYRLHVNGTFYAAGSSQDYKEGICQYNTDSCLFMCLKPKTYQYKDEWKHLGKDLKSETQIGLIAEEVAESHPELAILVNEEDNKVVRNVDYEKLSIVLLAEVQKLRHEMDQLKQN